MSIPVDVARLAVVLADFDAGYLLTTRDGSVKAVTVEPAVADDGTLRVAGPGRGTLANLATNAAATLLFQPREPRGYTLLVDGTAVADGDDVVLTPASAVLHRPHLHADGPPPPPSAGEGASCENDCRPVT